MLSNENQNYISEILFDLGSLLSTFESAISKREAVESIQRSLDIKALIFGVDHPDCMVVKERLNEIIFDSAQANTMQSSKNSSKLYMISEINTTTRGKNVNTRPSTSIKNYPETTSRIKLVNCIRELKSQLGNDQTLEHNPFDEWIKKNSIIEKIPSRLNRMKMENNSKSWEKNSIYTSQLERSIFQDRESSITYTQTETGSFSHSQQDSVDIRQENSALTNMIIGQNGPRSKTKIRKIEKINSAKSIRKPILAKLVSTRSRSASNPRLKASPINENSLHFRNCKCPTALSIDIHNSASVNGPNSSLKNILNSAVSNQNVREKNTKNIYYKSAWYDLPVGSCTRRYRNFIKIASTA